MYSLEVLALTGLIGMNAEKFGKFMKQITCNQSISLLENLQKGLLNQSRNNSV